MMLADVWVMQHWNNSWITILANQLADANGQYSTASLRVAAAMHD